MIVKDCRVLVETILRFPGVCISLYKPAVHDGRVTTHTPDETPAQRLDRLMNQRRLELGLRWATVCALAEITTSTLGAVRRGANPPSEFTRNSLDKALQLRPGNIQRILDGGDLERLDEPTQTLTTTAESDLSTALKIARELEERLLQKNGLRTGRQSHDLKLWILASQGLRDSLDDDE